MAIADKFGCTVDDLRIRQTTGGYSRNIRALVGYNGQWLFAKEVDVSILEDDGATELGWLKKDYEFTGEVARHAPAIVVGRRELLCDDTLLVTEALRPEDGWLWHPLTNLDDQAAYIDAVIAANDEIAAMTLDEATTMRLHAEPFFRDELAFDGGLELAVENQHFRSELIAKFTSMAAREGQSSFMAQSASDMVDLLGDIPRLRQLAASAWALHEQDETTLGHCDVRSDNVAYNPVTREVKLVDWNWASYAPRDSGPTEFLIDMAKHGIDVAPWRSRLNHEMLAGFIGLWLKRCLREPFSIGSNVREAQAQSAAAAYWLYSLSR